MAIIGNEQRRDGGIARPGSAKDGLDYLRADAAAEVILRGVEGTNLSSLSGG